MEYVEAEGKNIDEAIERALQQLGVERERVEIEILSDAARATTGEVVHVDGGFHAVALDRDDI